MSNGRLYVVLRLKGRQKGGGVRMKSTKASRTESDMVSSVCFVLILLVEDAFDSSFMLTCI